MRSSSAWSLLVALWFVGLPFGLVDLWWQHHWGLGPFDVAAWLLAQWTTLAPAAMSAMATIVLLVGTRGPVSPLVADRGARRRRDRRVVRASSSGLARGRRVAPAARPALAADVQRLERIEHVTGTPVRVQDVSQWTDQANAFTVGFGPSTHVVLWDTLLDGRFSRAARRTS